MIILQTFAESIVGWMRFSLIAGHSKVLCTFISFILVTGCSDFRDEHTALKEKTREAFHYLQKNDIDKAIRMMSELISEYPNQPQPYFGLMILKHEEYGLPQNVSELTNKEKKQLNRLRYLGKKGVENFNKIANQEEKAFLLNGSFNSLALSLANIYYLYGLYEESIDIYEQFYDVDKAIHHPKTKYYIVQYAKALGKYGYIEEGLELYKKLFSANEDDQKIRQSYVYYLADNYGYSKATIEAEKFVNNGQSNRIFYTLCELYAEQKDVEKAIECFKAFLENTNKPNVFIEGVTLAKDYILKNNKGVHR